LSSSVPQVSSASMAPSVSSGHSAKRHVGRHEHLDARRGHQLGQALAAEVGGMLHAVPAALAELV
jgi:hypothetical protein